MKNILITGVSRGLGLEISRVLLNEGYNVIGICRSGNHVTEQLAGEFNGRFSVIEYDLENTHNIKKMWTDKIAVLKMPIHAFIDNAAIAYDDLLTNMKLENLEKLFRVNVFSPMILTKLAIRNMLLYNTGGSIVHISSISAHTGYKGLSMYASTKGALEAFSKNTAREWGEKGIRSNCIVAGFMETDMSSKLNLDMKSRISKRTSLKTLTSVKSVAQTAAYLISDKADSITGQNIFVDAGTI
jgi:3-oxoacyl-[acyl-carrier protein] reductase